MRRALDLLPGLDRPPGVFRRLVHWLRDRAYYRIALTDTGTDNPDQRISEDINSFVSQKLSQVEGVGEVEIGGWDYKRFWGVAPA